MTLTCRQPLTLFWLALASVCVCACKSGDAPKQEASEAPSAEALSGRDKTPSGAQTKSAVGNAEGEEGGGNSQVIHAKTKSGEADIEVKAPPGWKVVQPPLSPDPHAGKFALADAVKGVKGKGALVARVATTLGDLYCDLYEDKAPVTVANFVGLARGVRKTWDGDTLTWAARKHYEGTSFHRVIPGFMIQGGDRTGDGSGRLWYQIPDELHPSLQHDRAGQLCMANRGPNTNEAQFFITDGPAPHLDGSYSIFGQCAPTELVYRIARVPQSGPPNNRPLTPLMIKRIDVMRVQGGAAQAHWPQEDADNGVLPRNVVPGVAPPGRAVHVE